MGLDVGDLLAVIEKYGCRQCEDFTMLDTVESEMWCNFKPKMGERPFPVDTGVEWLKGQFWNGNVWVWYCG